MLKKMFVVRLTVYSIISQSYDPETGRFILNRGSTVFNIYDDWLKNKMHYT